MRPIDTDPAGLDFLAKCGEVLHDAALKMDIGRRNTEIVPRVLDPEGAAHFFGEVARAGEELRAAIRASVRVMAGDTADDPAAACDVAIVLGSKVFTDPTYPRLK